MSFGLLHVFWIKFSFGSVWPFPTYWSCYIAFTNYSTGLTLSSRLRTLDLRANNLTKLPESLQNLNGAKLWLSKNPLSCLKIEPCSPSLKFWRHLRWRVQDIKNISCPNSAEDNSVLSSLKDNLDCWGHDSNSFRDQSQENLSDQAKMWIAFLCLSFLLLSGIVAFAFFFWKYGFEILCEKSDVYVPPTEKSRYGNSDSITSRSASRILRLQESSFY